MSAPWLSSHRSSAGISPSGVFAAGHFGKPLLFVAAVAAGVLTTAAVAVGLKSLRRTAPAASTARAATGTPKKAMAVGRA